jgi:hypothetical protein
LEANHSDASVKGAASRFRLSQFTSTYHDVFAGERSLRDSATEYLRIMGILDCMRNILGDENNRSRLHRNDLVSYHALPLTMSKSENLVRLRMPVKWVFLSWKDHIDAVAHVPSFEERLPSEAPLPGFFKIEGTLVIRLAVDVHGRHDQFSFLATLTYRAALSLPLTSTEGIFSAHAQFLF